MPVRVVVQVAFQLLCGLSPSAPGAQSITERAVPPLPVPPEKPEALAPPGGIDSSAMGFSGHVDSEEQKSRGVEGLTREKACLGGSKDIWGQFCWQMKTIR